MNLPPPEHSVEPGVRGHDVPPFYRHVHYAQFKSEENPSGTESERLVDVRGHG